MVSMIGKCFIFPGALSVQSGHQLCEAGAGGGGQRWWPDERGEASDWGSGECGDWQWWCWWQWQCVPVLQCEVIPEVSVQHRLPSLQQVPVPGDHQTQTTQEQHPGQYHEHLCCRDATKLKKRKEYRYLEEKAFLLEELFCTILTNCILSWRIQIL